MKLLRCPWNWSAKFFIIFAGIWVAVYLAMLVFNNETRSLLIFIAIWCVVSLLFYMLAKKNEQRLQRLKRDGIPFPAKVKDVLRLPGIRVGLNNPFYAACSFVNEEGITCFAKSKAAMTWLYVDKDILEAVVYVNRDDPTDYAVELFKKA